MADLSQGLILMMFGMGGVFIFLILLMFYIKVVPFLSRINIPPSKWLKTSRSIDKKMKLNTMLTNISQHEVKNGTGNNKVSEELAAAISAAIYSHTGEKPQKISITTPSGTTVIYNPWSVAGREDIMMSRDLTGQVGFQY